MLKQISKNYVGFLSFLNFKFKYNELIKYKYNKISVVKDISHDIPRLSTFHVENCTYFKINSKRIAFTVEHYHKIYLMEQVQM